MMWIALKEKPHTTTFDTFAVHSFSPHRRVLTRRRRFSNLLPATNSFYTSRKIDNFCKVSDATNKVRNYVIFFLFFILLGSNRFAVKPSPNSYPVKNSSAFKISGCLLLFSPKITSQQKSVLLRQRQMLNRENC